MYSKKQVFAFPPMRTDKFRQHHLRFEVTSECKILATSLPNSREEQHGCGYGMYVVHVLKTGFRELIGLGKNLIGMPAAVKKEETF